VSEFNIIGGNIFEYNAIEKLIQILNESGKFINYYINYRNVNLSPSDMKFCLMREDKTTVKVLIDFPIKEPIFSSVYNFLNKFDINKEYEFVITDKIQFDNINDLTAKIDLSNFTFRPFFNRKNINFFKKYVFLTKSDILSEKPSLDDIFCRMNINKFFYGKLFVLPNGDVHSNINSQNIGSIHTHSLSGLVLMEKMDGSSWKAIRSKIEPCRYCLYENICPPISNYEYVLGRYNLCNIKNGVNQ
jgi:pseudo-rSAM protein